MRNIQLHEINIDILAAKTDRRPAKLVILVGTLKGQATCQADFHENIAATFRHVFCKPAIINLNDSFFMKLKHYLLLPLLAATTTAMAQDQPVSSPHLNEPLPPAPRGYWGSGLDGAIFSTSFYKDAATPDAKLTTLRFTYVVNFGMNYNYDFTEHVGAFIGVGIKNIGLINKYGDSTVKRRVYTIGVPVGVKFGNLRNRNFGFLGAGFDVPFNYREKGFVSRKNKTKFSEWFSDRTPQFMPYVFAGLSLDPGVTLKFQFYPNNFFNQDFTTKNEISGLDYKPYKDMEAQLFLVSLGFDIHYKKLPREVGDGPRVAWKRK